MNGLFDVTDFGASPGAPDNSPAFNAAIAAAFAAGGGTVWIPAGRWKLGAQVLVKSGVRLVGAGKSGWHYPTSTAYAGTILEIHWGSGPGTAGNSSKAAILLEATTTITDIGFDYPGQDGNASAPLEWGSTIQTTAANLNPYNITIENIYLYKSYIGIDVRGSLTTPQAPTSNLTIRNCNGAPVYCGIAIDFVADWQTIENCKFNSGFINDSSPPFTGLAAWTCNNGVGLLIGGCDWLQVINVQIFGYNIGARIEAKSGYTGSGPYTFQSCQFDACLSCINLSGTFGYPVKVTSSNFAPYNPNTGAHGAALNVNDGVTINALQYIGNFVFSKPDFMVWMGQANQTVKNVIVADNIARTSGSAGAAVTVHNANNVQIINNIVEGFATPTSTSGSTNVVVQNNQT